MTLVSHRVRMVALLLQFFMLASCSEILEDSTDVETSSIFAEITVTENQNDNTLVFDVFLRLGGPSSYTLLGLIAGESITVDDGNGPQVMVQHVTGSYRYSYTDPVAVSTYTISLRRPDYADALNSQITIPAPNVIDAPLSGDAFSLANDSISINWTPAFEVGDPVYIQIYPTNADSCLTGYNAKVLVMPFVVAPGQVSTATSSCSGTIRLIHEAYGTIDPAFGLGGSFIASRYSELNIVVNP